MQRGRGAAFLWSRTHQAHARELLLECVLDDPRWDSQLEERGELYGEIAELVQFDCSPLLAFIETLPEEPDEDSPGYNQSAKPELAFDLIRRRAVAGDSAARAGLLRQLREGPLWHHALDEIYECEPLWEEAGQLIADRVSDAVFAAQLSLIHKSLDSQPWLSWRARHRTLERLTRAQAFEAAASAGERERVRKRVAAATTIELLGTDEYHAMRELVTRRSAGDIALLHAAVRSDDLPAQRLALEALGRQGDSDALEIAVDLVQAKERTRLRAAASRYLQRVDSSAILPLARQWFLSDGHLRTVGAGVLEQQAELGDVPFLCSELERAIESDDMHRVSTILNALLRFPDGAPRGLIESAFAQVPYALARMRAARVLAAADRARFADAYAYESLWDCEPATRELAAEHVDRSLPGASDRIAHIHATTE
jgi:hypothetical protein